jgi:hypothetical protein
MGPSGWLVVKLGGTNQQLRAIFQQGSPHGLRLLTRNLSTAVRIEGLCPGRVHVGELVFPASGLSHAALPWIKLHLPFVPYSTQPIAWPKLCLGFPSGVLLIVWLPWAHGHGD